MLDYNVPPDIPQAVIEYADKYCPIPKSDDIVFKRLDYYTIWNDQEVYFISYSQKLPYKHPQYGQGFRHVNSHIILYNCHEAYLAPKEIMNELEDVRIRHFSSSSERYHVCTSD